LNTTVHQGVVISAFRVNVSSRNLTFRGPCIVIYSNNKSQRDAVFLNFIMVKNSTCFGTDFLSIFRSLYTVFIAIRICHTSYVDCLQTLNITSMTNTYCCEYSIKNPDDGQNICPKHVEFFTKIKFRNCASCWLLLLECIIKGINIYNRQKVPRNFWI